MILLPAIDLKNGECVRLFQGDYATARKVADDAVKTAQSFEKEGAEWLHLVDLNGAKASKPVNADLMFRIRRNTNLKLEVGGGIREMKTIDYYLENGISRVILGTAAVSHPELVKQAVQKYGDRIAVGIDARNGFAARQGWTETSEVDYITLAKEMEQDGVKYLIFTDISRDGTLSGPNLNMLDHLNNTVSCHIIASGGVSNLKDIANLLDLNLYGVICGKAIYTGDLNLSMAVELCRKAVGLYEG